MEERWNLRRVTRLDALIVGAICLLLIALVPVLFAKPREQSVRLLCGANLAQIGKAMLIYANDYEGALPRAGGPYATWGAVANWTTPNRYQAFGLNARGENGSATISSCFYLLVKHYEAPTRLFICRDDKGTTEFRLSNGLVSVLPGFKLANAWDFGMPSDSFKHCSYSYHFPFGRYFLTTSRDPNLAVAADRSPWISSPMAVAASLMDFRPDISGFGGAPKQACVGNAIAHGRDGQNVLFLDGRVAFEKRSYCAVDNDNIYLISPDSQHGSPKGTVPVPPTVVLLNEQDSVLVHDPDMLSFGATKKP